MTLKKIQDVMTLCPHSVGFDQPLKVAKSVLHQYDIRHLPVLKGGEVVGIVTDRDINMIYSYVKDDSNSLQVKDAYTPEPYMVAPEAPLRDVVLRMSEDKMGSAIIVEKGKVIGIFTTTDACRVLAELL